MAEAIRVDGLAQFSRNLKKLDSDLPKALRVALNQAADLVVKDARPRVPKKTGRAAKSMRAASTRTASRVRAGGARAKYYPWLDFGGTVGKGRRGRAGQRGHVEGSVKRPFLKEGRYIYRSFYDLRAAGEFQQEMAKALLDVVRQAGFEVD